MVGNGGGMLSEFGKYFLVDVGTGGMVYVAQEGPLGSLTYVRGRNLRGRCKTDLLGLCKGLVV